MSFSVFYGKEKVCNNVRGLSDDKIFIFEWTIPLIQDAILGKKIIIEQYSITRHSRLCSYTKLK